MPGRNGPLYPHQHKLNPSQTLAQQANPCLVDEETEAWRGDRRPLGLRWCQVERGRGQD